MILQVVKNAFFVAVLSPLLAVPGIVMAQVDVQVSDMGDVEQPEDVFDVFSDEGLGDDDLTTDLEAEALPTTNAWGYRWENWKDGVISVFTFNSERKAEHMRSRLHKLDRKMEACAEIGDPECSEKIEKRIAELEERTEKYIAKREELKVEFEDRFEAWREKREEHRVDLELKVNEHKARRAKLIEERKAKRDMAIQNRKVHIEDRKARIEIRREERKGNVEQRQIERQENVQERRDERQENIQERQIDREQNREHLIEVRSGNLKNRLDDTRLKVDGHDAVLEDAIAE